MASQNHPESKSAGKLYVVATPIGNIEDISLRALRILKTADFIIAENCSITKKLLGVYQLSKEVCTYRPRGRSKVIEMYLERILSGEFAVIVCDAGTPSVADPGFQLTTKAAEKGIQIEAIPGACVISAALSICGWPSGKYTFTGFPPRSRSDRQQFFQDISAYPRPVVLFESSAYLSSTILSLRKALGCSSQIFLGRDITKKTELQMRTTLGAEELMVVAKSRGEYVLIIT